MTRIFADDFFPADVGFFTVFPSAAFVLRADDVVANPSVPFDAPIGVHFIFRNDSLELHLEQQQRDVRSQCIRQAIQNLVHRERMIEGQHLIDAGFFRGQPLACRTCGRRYDLHLLENLLR